MEGEIAFRTVIEVLGKPKEHVEKTMQQVINKLKDTKDLELLEQDLGEAKEVEGIWGTFVDIKLSFRDVNKIIEYCFAFLPSSIEILEPDNLKLDQKNLSLWFNDILTALHKYDLALKKLIAENRVLKRKLE